MKRLIVRFRNQNDLDLIGDKLNLKLNKNVKEINLNTLEIAEKKNKNQKNKISHDWEKEWVDMPEFNTTVGRGDYAKINIHYSGEISYLNSLFEQKITDKTLSIWFPKLVAGVHRRMRVIGGDSPKYPIYVISKGRSWMGKSHTSFRLTQMNIKHYLVVEPNEYNDYYNNFENEYCNIIKMDMIYKDTYDCFSDLGRNNSTGAGAVRNFCWDHSIKNGFEWHWVLDDNIEGFDRYYNCKKIMALTGEVFRSCERFVDRYTNIAIAGLNYSKFCMDGNINPPYILNTRIYSMLLIRNDIPYRWRGRYNEDTDLSLRVLKDNWCTIQFNLFTGAKRTTQQKKGGNTEEFYSKEGTIPKSQMLVDMHPDVAKLVWKYNRWHHQVDYSGFNQKLKIKEDIVIGNKINEFGMKIIEIPKEICNTKKDNLSYIINNY